ncbi:unnamed protein product [Clavelina lepadiformis]|uniref:Activating signal cointegrator 1 complex subunit 3 n=1 Tax=Clavelina lepadiformis TaxID=159417 RepID=A0ABP0GHU7_CLALP
METSDSREENSVKVQRIEVYRTYIEDKIEPVDAVCIASSCKKDGVFSNGDFRFIRYSQESQQVAALLDKLLENQTKVNWYGSFTQALRENDLEYVVDYFEGRIRESFLESHFRQILDIHAQKFLDDFDPNIILPLHGNNLFSLAHRDLIAAERTQRGRAFKFLMLLQKRPNWFHEFVEILRDPDCGNLTHFAELLQPKDQNSSNTFEDFINFSSSDIFDELEPNDILNRLSHIEETRKNRIQSMPSREKRVIALFEELSSIQFKLWYKEFIMALAEQEKYNHLVDTLNPVEGIKTKKMAQKDDADVMVDAGTYSEGTSNNDQVLDAAPVCSPTVDTEEDEDMISDNNYEKHEVEESEKKAFTENPPVCNSNHPDDVTAPFKTPEKTVVISAGSKPELCLREYQDELATPALNGKNSMIVAPTGSGKTFVALKVCIEQLKSRSDAKVIFLVPRVPLVEQQFNLFKKHLPEEEDMIFKVTGEMSSSIPVHISVERHRVTIMTAQILLNIFNDGLMTISDISLLIFDECHHAVKSDPYSMIMNCYLDVMKENASRTSHLAKRLPQILGMTASPGMGKAKTMIKAEENIKTLMATLDITIAPTQVNETVGNLLQYRNTASDEVIVVQRKVDDQFCLSIKKAMEEIENLTKEHIEAQEAVHRGRLKYDLRASPGSQDYESWAVSLLNKSKLIEDRRESQRFMSYSTHLREYNTSLMLNDHVRSTEAFAYIEEKLFGDSQNSLPSDETGETLKMIFETNRPRLTNNTNPLLERLQRKLAEEFYRLPQSRCIIFVKTRAIAKALLTYLNEQQDLARFHLNAKQLTGAGARSESGGMTKPGQEDTLQAFKDGRCKVIVATSVAEEGLDIKACNLIITYNYSTNEIGQVQRKGRGRADNSKVVMLAYDDSGHVKRERENKIRVELTDEILKTVKGRDPKILKSQIRKIQEKLEKDRSFMKTVKEHKEKQKVPDDRMIYKLSCLWCKKTVTSSQHLRHINMQHRVVVDPKFPSLAYFLEVPDGNEGKQIGDDEFVIGKILCKNDKCRRQWGLRMRYKTCPISVLKIQNFLITGERGYRSVKKKWKEVPFNSLGKELDGDDLRVLLRTRVRRDGTMELDELEDEDE